MSASRTQAISPDIVEALETAKLLGSEFDLAVPIDDSFEIVHISDYDVELGTMNGYFKGDENIKVFIDLLEMKIHINKSGSTTEG